MRSRIRLARPAKSPRKNQRAMRLLVSDSISSRASVLEVLTTADCIARTTVASSSESVQVTGTNVIVPTDDAMIDPVLLNEGRASAAVVASTASRKTSQVCVDVIAFGTVLLTQQYVGPCCYHTGPLGPCCCSPSASSPAGCRRSTCAYPGHSSTTAPSSFRARANSNST